MSEFYEYGDMVIVGSDTTPVYPINGDAFVPTSIPREYCIVDCSGDEPTAYSPYRVYTGDMVILVPTLEGYTLIPEDISGDGDLYDATGVSKVGYAGIGEVVQYCLGYHWYVNGVYKSTTACPGFQGRPSGVPADAVFHGWVVNIRAFGGKTLEILSRNAYEYIDISLSGFGNDANDRLYFPVSYTGSPRPIEYSVIPGGIRIEAYPGFGGTFGLPQSEGGDGTIAVALGIFGYRDGQTRTDYNEAHLDQNRTLQFTFKNTGRYGNYR